MGSSRSGRLWASAAAIGVALTLVAGLLTGLVFLSGTPGPGAASSAGKPVAVRPVQGRKMTIQAMRPYHQPRTAWPAAQTATASITAANPPAAKALPLTSGPSAGSGQAGNLPVWVGPPDAASSRTAGKTVTSARGPSAVPVSRAQVRMAPYTAASALGVHGVVFSIGRADGSTAAGQIHVSLDYSSFAHAYGGDYAARLRLVELPACALTRPQAKQCRIQTPVESADSVRASQVGADVSLPGTSTATVTRPGTTVLTVALSSSLVLAATAAISGSTGNYGVEPASESIGWVNGGSSGAYDYSYPIQIPPVPGRLEPTVSLNYDSQATDSLTSGSNNQASWAGDGWDYSPGYIEEEYVPCSSEQNQLGLTFPNTGDLCPQLAGQSLTLSLNGVSSTMVQDSKGNYSAEADDGGKIEYKGSATSIGNAGSYWELLEPDGTDYYFGLNQLPGYASGDQTTNSAWTAPDGAQFDTGPALVWRWNLDYAVDAHGDAIAYFYNTQVNYYAELNGTTGNGQYTQGGTLATIEYGLRAGSI